MTYRELAHRILDMTEEQIDCDLIIYDEYHIEFAPIHSLRFAFDEDNDPAAGILDDNHPYLVFQGI